MLEWTGWLGHELGETSRRFLEAEGDFCRVASEDSLSANWGRWHGHWASDGGRLSGRSRAGGAGMVEGVTFGSFHVSMVLASEEEGRELEEANRLGASGR